MEEGKGKDSILKRAEMSVAVITCPSGDGRGIWSNREKIPARSSGSWKG